MERRRFLYNSLVKAGGGIGGGIVFNTLTGKKVN